MHPAQGCFYLIFRTGKMQLQTFMDCSACLCITICSKPGEIG